MKQIITKDNHVECVTTVPYPPEVIKAMKKAGYKIKEVKDDDTTGIRKSCQ
jgi:predicted fused transcriptional regulator/phosphomethylpyrimidine kinase